ncbi:hypothetical protein BJ322DRAFT_1015948 [Thelephora terrestris]|uniref:Uncharacterized protein n=1 Tax=Thelephora terrestris TaxID=56493 RepID=A0A9P6LC26_9AGAM|nr:hypothetical protein BJ322DRAFT_1015948 [Thelephora terrestris]
MVGVVNDAASGVRTRGAAPFLDPCVDVQTPTKGANAPSCFSPQNAWRACGGLRSKAWVVRSGYCQETFEAIGCGLGGDETEFDGVGVLEVEKVCHRCRNNKRVDLCGWGTKRIERMVGLFKARFELDRKHRVINQTADVEMFLIRTERKQVAKCTIHSPVLSSSPKLETPEIASIVPFTKMNLEATIPALELELLQNLGSPAHSSRAGYLQAFPTRIFDMQLPGPSTRKYAFLKQGQGASDTIMSITMPSASIVTHRLETTGKRAGELSVDDLKTSRLFCVLRDSVAQFVRLRCYLDPGDILIVVKFNQDQCTEGLRLILFSNEPASRDDGIFAYTFDGTSEDGYTDSKVSPGFEAVLIGGVTKGPNVVAAKVLGDDGNGQNIDIVYDLDFVVSDFQRNGTPTVAPLSLGSCISNAVDSPVVRVEPDGQYRTFAILISCSYLGS